MRGAGLAAWAAAAAAVLAAAPARGDIYMHNPRGSNNRNCRRDNGKARRNANRLFDSQNNDNGGYSCPRAWPFDCYRFVDDEEGFNACANENNPASKDQINADGTLKNKNAINTPMMYYYSGSTLRFEWTVQHGLGPNNELHSQMVIQYSCEEQLTDNCGEESTAPANQCKSPFQADPALGKTCGPRDGTPVRVVDNVDEDLNVEATRTIPEENEAQDDLRYGRHETLSYYRECRRRERNKGLYTADQNVNPRGATGTRQNPNGARYGFECPEESEYWPYWHHSPWIDIAVLAEDDSRCDEWQAESQNVKPRNRCDCGTQCQNDGEQPNNKIACEQKGFTWCEDPPHNKPPPECIVAEFNRQNHLGNTVAGTNTNTFNWTIPEVTRPTQCVLRIRYNISTYDGNDVTVFGTHANNDLASPVYDNDENEALTYLAMENLGLDNEVKLGFAVNTDQYGRTFQDRSYMFEIRPPLDEGPCSGRKIHNLNVRGKRGNIVQAYPAVEYDFVPSRLVVPDDECVHVQFSGSDYNPQRNGNDAEGGPYSSNNRNREQKADRSNIAFMANAGDNFPMTDVSKYGAFDVDVNTYRRLLFLDQQVDNEDVCLSFERLNELFPGRGNRAQREETHLNCAKLSGQQRPYFDAGALPMGDRGTYFYMSTRNNNFSNRGHKGVIMVVRGGLSIGAIVGIVFASLTLISAGVLYRKKGGQFQDLVPYKRGPAGGAASGVVQAAGPAEGSSRATSGMFAGGITSLWKGGAATRSADGNEYVKAMHYHDAQEAGELSFKKNDKIRVIAKDDSGWWEGEVNGKRGLFPSNFTKPQ